MREAAGCAQSSQYPLAEYFLQTSVSAHFKDRETESSSDYL